MSTNDPLAAGELCRILVGVPVLIGVRNAESAMATKKPLAGRIAVSHTGLPGDAQGDKKHHGGPEKALHQYPFEHYAAWIAERPGLATLLAAPGAFGENLSTLGMTEATVCIGDVYRLGDALLQVSRTRHPCWRLNVRFDDSQMSRRMQNSRRVGWYYRVLEEDEIGAGDRFLLADRPHPDWSLMRLMHHLYDDTLNYKALEAIVGLSELEASFRGYAAKRLATHTLEDWRERLDVPAD